MYVCMYAQKPSLSAWVVLPRYCTRNMLQGERECTLFACCTLQGVHRGAVPIGGLLWCRGQRWRRSDIPGVVGTAGEFMAGDRGVGGGWVGVRRSILADGNRDIGMNIWAPSCLWFRVGGGQADKSLPRSESVIITWGLSSHICQLQTPYFSFLQRMHMERFKEGGDAYLSGPFALLSGRGHEERHARKYELSSSPQWITILRRRL